MTENFDYIESVRVLYEISTLIQSDSRLEEKFEQALRLVRDAVNSHSASLFIHNHESGKLEETATIGKRVDLIENIPFEMGQGFSAWVAKQRKSVLIPNLRKDRHDGFRSFISTPLVSGDKLIGVMNIGHEKPNAFTEKVMEFLEIIAGQLAHTIKHAHYERMLIEKNEALLKAQKEIEKQQKQIIEMEKYQVLGQVVVSINHEINNPLTTVTGTIELLLMANPDMDPAMHNKLTTVLKEARRIAEIIGKLRNIKKIKVENYLGKYGEQMIDIESSSES